MLCVDTTAASTVYLNEIGLEYMISVNSANVFSSAKSRKYVRISVEDKFVRLILIGIDNIVERYKYTNVA